MSVADLQELEEVKTLVVKGQATGVLTYAEAVSYTHLTLPTTPYV